MLIRLYSVNERSRVDNKPLIDKWTLSAECKRAQVRIQGSPQMIVCTYTMCIAQFVAK